jgi:hypothetical protein
MTEPGTNQSGATDPGRGRPGWFRRRVQVHAYLGEAILLVGLMAVLNLAFMPAQPGFLGIEPNPYWVPLLLIVVRYGFRAGLFVSLITASTYMVSVGLRVKEDVIGVRDLFSWQYARPAVLFVVGGVILGLLVQRHKDRVAKLEQENSLLARENQALKRGEEELRDVNVELANRVVGATDTLPMLYKYAKKLNVLDVNAIFTALTELVADVAKAGQAAVYVLVPGSRRLEQHSRNGERRGGPELEIEPEVFEEVVLRRKVISLHDLLARNIKRKLYLCGPLSAGAGGEVLAVLTVEELDFLRYNPATIRLFNVIIDWACASLERAAQYSDHPEQLRMEQAKTSILRAERAASLAAAPAVVSAGLMPAVTGAITGAAAPRPGATARKPGRPRDAEPVGPELLPTGTGSTALGDLLDQAQVRLFGEVAAPQPVGPEALHGVEVADLTVETQLPPDGQSLAELQRMMTGELRIASNYGSPLAKLLAEIDGFVASARRAR